jgi:O-methyltransferase involved in polyketide biosynthesis
VVELDALADGGPRSLAAVADQHLDRSRGLAIVTEGLINYFDRPELDAMWRRFARELALHPRGLYLSDMHLGEDMARVRVARAFTALLSAFVRGRVHLHFEGEAQAGHAVLAAGFAEARLHRPAGPGSGGAAGRVPVRILEARTAAAG